MIKDKKEPTVIRNVRLPVSLWKRLGKLAAEKEWSINHYIAYILQEQTKPR